MIAWKNTWNLGRIGNNWDDFSSNTGYPGHYEVQSGFPGTDIDWNPVGETWPWCIDFIDEDVNLSYDLDCSGWQFATPYGFLVGDNVTIDCNGHSIHGGYYSGSDGIRLSQTKNAVVKNCVVTNYQDGISIEDSQDNTISNNSLVGNSNGITMSSSTGNMLISNYVSNQDGIEISDSNFNNFANNTLFNNSYGFQISGSNSNNFTGNIARDNRYIGFYVTDSNNSLFANNILNYSDDWGFYLTNSHNNTLKGNHNCY